MPAAGLQAALAVLDSQKVLYLIYMNQLLTQPIINTERIISLHEHMNQTCKKNFVLNIVKAS
jgi:hypothetical protein